MKNESYYEKDTKAVYCFGLLDIEIKDIVEEDGEIYAYCVCNGNKHRLKVHFTAKGDYFVFNGRRVHLSNCLRVDS